MTKKIFILVGTPGSGKTWVANQIRDQYTYVPHDKYKIGQEYLNAIKSHAMLSEKPVVIETPFSLSQLQNPLVDAGYDVKPVFIIEQPSITRQRYEARSKKPIPQGHLTRIETYLKRAEELKAPMGTSSEILDYMRNHADKEGTLSQGSKSRSKHEAHDAQRNHERDEEAQRAQLQDPQPEAVHDVRPWAMGENFWQKD